MYGWVEHTLTEEEASALVQASHGCPSPGAIFSRVPAQSGPLGSRQLVSAVLILIPEGSHIYTAVT